MSRNGDMAWRPQDVFVDREESESSQPVDRLEQGSGLPFLALSADSESGPSQSEIDGNVAGGFATDW